MTKIGKYLILIISPLFESLAYSQLSNKLENKKWINVNVERKDGSKVVDSEMDSESQSITYFFKKGKLNATFSMRAQSNYYDLKDSILTLGKFQKYKLENVNDTSLVMSEITMNLPDDKVNRYYFISNDNLERYAKKHELLKFENDTVIFSNSIVTPSLDIADYIKNLNINSNVEIKGSILFNPYGIIKEIKYLNSDSSNKEVVKNLNKIINSTSRKWTMPNISKKYYIRMPFKIGKLTQGGFVVVLWMLHDINKSFVSNRNIKKSKAEFVLATQLYSQGKFIEAKGHYDFALTLDSLNTDAYYNRAATNFKLKMLSESCNDWKQLMNLGQKEGERLYNANCIK